MIGRIINRILHRLIRGTVEHPIRFVLVLLVVLGAAALAITRTGMPALSLALPTAPSFHVGNAAPSATENYMKGTETFNAQLVWDSLSDDAQSRYTSRGGSMQALQDQMNHARDAGAQLDQVTYIGGQSFPDGTSMHFYTVLTKGPQSQSAAEPIPYVFTLDPSGKIVRVQ